MYVLDFEYDGRRLSDFGFIVCGFGDSSGIENMSVGSRLTFNKVPLRSGKRYGLTSTKYEECITATIDICKNPDRFDDAMALTDEEVREMTRWLNRREFCKFKAFDPWEIVERKCYYNATFNIEKIVFGDGVYGLRLEMETDSPFGYMEKESTTITVGSVDIDFVDESDEIGYQYPSLTITCLGSGNLALYNDRMDVPMIINGCTNGEVINIDGNAQIITTSVPSHKIYNNFNYNFFKIVNSYDNRVNKIHSSIPITLTLDYAPTVKNAL